MFCSPHSVSSLRNAAGPHLPPPVQDPSSLFTEYLNVCIFVILTTQALNNLPFAGSPRAERRQDSTSYLRSQRGWRVSVFAPANRKGALPLGSAYRRPHLGPEACGGRGDGVAAGFECPAPERWCAGVAVPRGIMTSVQRWDTSSILGRTQTVPVARSRLCLDSLDFY